MAEGWGPGVDHPPKPLGSMTVSAWSLPQQGCGRAPVHWVRCLWPPRAPACLALHFCLLPGAPLALGPGRTAQIW